MDMWYAIMVVGVVFAIAVSFGIVQIANTPIAVACVEAGSSWVAKSNGSECIAKGYKE